MEKPDLLTAQLGQTLRGHIEAININRKFFSKKQFYLAQASKIKCDLGTFFVKVSDEQIFEGAAD